MKYIKSISLYTLVALCISSALTGCYKLQEDYNRTPKVIDPKIYKTTWDYIKSRGYGSATDTIFRRMYDAIIYSGIDTMEYIKTGRTFILMNNNSGRAVWAGTRTAANVVGKKWEDYPKAAVKAYLQYLILDSVYDHYTIPALTNVGAKTLAPAGTFTATTPVGFIISATMFNPLSVMNIQVLNSSPGNTSDYPIQLNDVLNVQTSSILATNGSIHVINTFLSPTVPQ